MDKMIRNDRARVIFLNAPLIIVFVSAWVCDRWPSLTVPAILTSLLIVISEVYVLYLSAKHVSKETTSLAAQAESDAVSENNIASNLIVQQAMLEMYESLTPDLNCRPSAGRAYRLLASQPQTWAIASAQGIECMAIAPLPKNRFHSLPPEMKKWKLIGHSDDVFNVQAGAFEIEFFHGKTNIRILDSTHITVVSEGETDKDVKFTQKSLKPIYQ